MKILVIDDDELIGRSLRRALRHHLVTVTSSTLVGIGLLADALADASPFALILCDLSMPSGSGLDVLRAIADMRDRPFFVLMTGRPIDSARLYGRRRPDAILEKPFNVAGLDQLFEKLLDERSNEITAA